MVQNSPCRILAYQRPTTQRHTLPNPVLATLLHLPGTCCWLLLASILSGIPKWLRLPSIELVLWLWGLAVVTAIISLILYLPDRIAKPWYVGLNLFVNTCGIIFTAFPGAALLLLLIGLGLP